MNNNHKAFEFSKRLIDAIHKDPTFDALIDGTDLEPSQPSPEGYVFTSSKSPRNYNKGAIITTYKITVTCTEVVVGEEEDD